MTRFVVDLGDLKMSKEAQMALSTDLQKTALAHLAGIRFEDPFITKFPRDWWGLIARKDFEGLLDGEKILGRAFLTAKGAM